jgi:PKD repeat protein
MKLLATTKAIRMNSILLLAIISLLAGISAAENPSISNHLINLSSSVNAEALDDVKPEMLISGNTIHLAWIEYKYGSEQWLYYRRSGDLGKTWDNPRQLLRLSLARWDRSTEPATRFMAVDGQTVHIAIADHKDDKRLMLYRQSTDGGLTFGAQKELLPTTGVNYWAYRNSMVRAANGKVAIAFSGPDDNPGIKVLFSGDGGNTFTEKTVSKEYVNLADFWYDGSHMIFLGDIRDIYLSTGKVFASVSSDDGNTLKTSKISRSFKDASQNTQEQSIAYHNYAYSAKIAKSGNTIHIVFSGVENGSWTTFYARSANNGDSFEEAKDINGGVLPSALLSNYMETVAAENGNVYLLYATKQNKIWFLSSSDNGSSFSQPASILPDKVSYVDATGWPNFVTDKTDPTGKTFYVYGYNFFSIKSVDGGKSFFNSSLAAPYLMGDFQGGHARLILDNKGQKHWIGEARFRKGTDKDIFYRYAGEQPIPGDTNKSCLIETTAGDKAEVVIIPSTPALNFGPAMTAEAWVKIDPSTEGKINILAKINGYDGDDIYPFFDEVSGYSMGFQKSGSKFAVHTRLVTDKGKFINSGNYELDDNLWHHMAITYDAQAGTNNFKTYFDGLLIKEQTVTGDILQGDGLLMIGSRQSYLFTSKYEVDDIRLWGRALTQEELLQNQVKKLNGKEEGLKVFLNFDDTFRDISGNGHDALPVYLGKLINSNFDPPVPEFEVYKTNNQIAITNNTQNGTDNIWYFGDGSTSDKGNPAYTYPVPGEYKIFLTTSNNNSISSTFKKVTIEGLSHVEPSEAGNYGYTTLSVIGGGLIPEGTLIILRKEGSNDIVGEGIYAPKSGIISAKFLLHNVELGIWDVVVKRGTNEQTLKKGLKIVPAKMPSPWATLTGRHFLLTNTWQTYTLTYGNNGNVDAYAVPIYFAITDDEEAKIEFIDFKMDAPQAAYEKGLAEELMAQGEYIITEYFMGDSFNAKVFPFIIPVIPANSSKSIHIRIKSSKNIQLGLITGTPLIDFATDSSSVFNKSAAQYRRPMTSAECIIYGLAHEIIDIGLTFAFETFGATVLCIYKGVYWVASTGSGLYYGTETLGNSLWNISFAAAECGIALASQIAWPIRLVVSTVVSGVKNLKAVSDCLETGQFISSLTWPLYAIGSLDPNEMIGPAGFGNQNWIKKNRVIPYTILFENKSEATAPAHIVAITDTLDLSVFDISDFGFGSFGWGDTIFSPPGNKLKEFSMDIDMRPEMQLITRVSAKLDTLTGIIKWEFLSLNPVTMDIEEDPFTGFLPPNATSPEGEGFVSFSVGLREELKTNDVLRNKASIVFDANEPIITNEYINTIDMDEPESRVAALEATTKDFFTVSWSGSDQGSGIKGYSVYVLENDTLLYPWKTYTKETSAVFVGEVGSTYKFYSVAVDNVSLLENDPGTYDAFTTVTVDIEEFELKKSDLTVYPNPVAGRLTVILPNAPCGAYVVEVRNATGQAYYSEIHYDYALSSGLSFDMKDAKPGVYIVRLVYGNQSVSKSILVR